MTELYPDDVILENIMENDAMDTFMDEPGFLSENSTLAPMVKMSTMAATSMKATMTVTNAEIDEIKQSVDTFFILINSQSGNCKGFIFSTFYKFNAQFLSRQKLVNGFNDVFFSSN